MPDWRLAHLEGEFQGVVVVVLEQPDHAVAEHVVRAVAIDRLHSRTTTAANE